MNANSITQVISRNFDKKKEALRDIKIPRVKTLHGNSIALSGSPESGTKNCWLLWIIEIYASYA